jgi:predicted DNA-binding transcriptional regulator YafY
MLKTRSVEDTREIFDRVISRHRPVTISYVRENGSTTVRTIEAYEIKETKAGNLIVRAMDRETGESRSWRLDRMTSYTIHRSVFLTPRPVINATFQGVSQ